MDVPTRGSLPEKPERSILFTRVPVLVALVLLLLTSGSALAQAPTPGTVGELLRPDELPLTQPKVSPLPRLPSTPVPAVVTADDRRIPIKQFTFKGNTLYTEEQLRAVIADLEGQDLTLAQIYQAADRISNFFKKEGYSLTTATVPAQRMLEGVLLLEVVEGRIAKLSFIDNRRYSDKFLARQMRPLVPGAIVRFDHLEQELLLLNELPGLVARSVMLPGDDYGTTNIELRTEEKLFGLFMSLDNQGREVVGKWRAGIDLIINNPSTRGDVIGLGYTHAQSGLLKQGRISYDFPLWHNGTRLNLNYSRAEYDVGREFAQLGISGVSETARVQLVYPQRRTRLTSVNWVAAGVRIRGSSDMDDIPLSDDTIHFAEFGVNLSHRFADGSSTALSLLLATNFRSSDDGSDSKALPPRLELRGHYEYPFARAWSLFVRGEAVWASDLMPDSNKYGIGGPATVRGYVGSQVRGDQGAAGTLELRRLLQFSKVLMQARSFVDAGVVNRKSVAGVAEDSESITSAGVGLTAYIAGRYALDGSWAVPLDGKDSGEGRDSQFWVTLSASF